MTKLSAQRILKMDAAIRMHRYFTRPTMSDPDVRYKSHVPVHKILRKMGIKRTSFDYHFGGLCTCHLIDLSE